MLLPPPLSLGRVLGVILMEGGVINDEDAPSAGAANCRRRRDSDEEGSSDGSGGDASGTLGTMTSSAVVAFGRRTCSAIAGSARQSCQHCMLSRTTSPTIATRRSNAIGERGTGTGYPYDVLYSE